MMRAELRAQRQNQRKAGRTPVGRGGIHLGGRHHTDVLTIGGGAGAAAEAGDGGAQAVGEQSGADLVVIITSGHLGDGLNMAHVFSNQHQHHRDEHRQNGEVDLRGVEMRQTDPGGLADGGEIDLAAAACVGIADDHTKKNVQAPHQTLEQHSHQQHGHQGDDGGVGRDLEVVPHAWSEVEADDGHDGAVDDRWHDDVGSTWHPHSARQCRSEPEAGR